MGCLLERLALGLMLILAASHSAGEPAPAGYTHPKILRWFFEVENPSGQRLTNPVFRTYGPVPQTSTQFVEQLDADAAFELERDDVGNQIMVFRLGDMAPYSRKILTITARLRMALQPQALPLPDPELFRGSESFLEADHPEIKAAAAPFRHLSASGAAGAITAWVGHWVHDEGFVAEELGALHALRHRRGDCTEFSDLFAALMRSLDLPARVLGGFVVQDGRFQARPETYHNWSEYYDLGAWHIADAQKGVLEDRRGEYVALHVFSHRSGNSMKEVHRFSTQGGVIARMIIR